MNSVRAGLSDAPESVVVGLARSGDRDAFAELVRRRQSWIRNLMRRCSGDTVLADDLAQQVFFKAWQNIGRLQSAGKFAAWLQRIAVNTWLQHVRAKDALQDATDLDDVATSVDHGARLSIDLNDALGTLSEGERLCVVLSYHEGMTHQEIADMTKMPLGTVKSHIYRGTERLQQVLAAYRETDREESAS